MKKLLPLIYLLLVSSIGFAQNKGTPYVVQFSDKANSGFTISNPYEYLSERAVERRLLQQIPINQSDLPVSKIYLNEIEQHGAEIIYTSKWLNTAIAYIDHQESLQIIKNLPFVKSVTQSGVLEAKRSNQPFKRFFNNDKFQKISTKNLKTITNENYVFNYGPSGNQVQMLKVDQLHNQGYTGKGVLVAVMDAGFNSVNVMTAFDSLRANNLIAGTRDFVQPGNNVYNTGISSHGTMVLSTMGGNIPGQLVGTAPHATYWLMRTEDATAEYIMEEYYWVHAAEYADSLGVDIINTSLGYTVFDNPLESHTYSDMDGNTTPITIGADMAAQKGMLVINSAGNEGGNDWRYISAPADGDSVLTVGAVDNMGIYAYFSSIGPTADGRIKPDVSAQGYGAVVANVPSGIAQASGTSFSSPILSGAAACLWQANPTFSAMDLLNAIRQSGSTSLNPNNLIGWGIPDFVVANSLLVGTFEQPIVSANVKCYPNPFTSYIDLDVELIAAQNTDIKLINSYGKVVKVMQGISLVQGTNRVKINDLNSLPNGIYVLSFSDGLSIINQKVIK